MKQSHQDDRQSAQEKRGADDSKSMLLGQAEGDEEQNRSEDASEQKKQIGRSERIEERGERFQYFPVRGSLDTPQRKPVGDHGSEQCEESDDGDPDQTKLSPSANDDTMPGIRPERACSLDTNPTHHIDAGDRLFGLLFFLCHLWGTRFNRS